ncbi:hypothetical protein D3C85_1439290 [compost metagenome]
MPGHRHCEIYLAEGITAQSRRTVIAGRHLYAGVARKMDQGLTMRDRLIGRLCWTMPEIYASKLNKVSSPLPPRKTDFPASTGSWLHFAVISM